MRLPLVGPSGISGRGLVAASESQNLYQEMIEDPEDRTRNIAVLRNIPGTESYFTLAGGNCRGLWSGGGRLFSMGGSHLYELSQGSYLPGSGGTGMQVSDYNTGANDGEPVQMFGNGNQLALVNSGLLYVSNGGAPAQIFFTDRTTGLPTTDPVTTVTGAYLDSTLYVQRPSGGTPDLGRQVSYCQPNNFSLWYGTDFFSKEGDATYIQSILADREQLYVFGAEESEVWQNDPSTGLPVRIPGAAAREGSIGRWAPVSLAQSVYFLGGSPRGGIIAYKLRGFTPVRISTHAVEQAWRETAAVGTNVLAYPYIEDGHQFWVLNFPGPTNTWVYDETASGQFGYPVWHQRGKWVPPSGGFAGYFGPYVYAFHTFIPEWGANGIHIVGDRSSGKLYGMSSDIYADAGADIYWRRAIPHRYGNGNRIYFGRQTLTMGSDPSAATTVSRDYSDDGGQTWKNPQAPITGVTAEGTPRTYWPTGGSSYGRVWRYSGNGGSRVSLIDLQADETPGTV